MELTELMRAEAFGEEAWAGGTSDSSGGGSDGDGDGSDVGDLVNLCAVIFCVSVALLSFARSSSTLCIATNF